MKWIECKLLRILADTTDRLGNEIKKTELERNIKARLTSWTSEDVNLYGRDLTNSTRKLVTPNKVSLSNRVVQIEDTMYKVVKEEDNGRFRVAVIEEWGIWQNSV